MEYQEKKCTKCKKIKSISEFYIHKNHGITPRCKSCAREYHRENIISIKEKKKKYYIDHTEHIKAKSQKYRDENREKLLKYFNDYYKKYPEKAKISALKRRAFTRGVDAEKIDPTSVYEEHGWICGICGKKINNKLKHPNPKSVSLDHITPISKGGNHTYSNVQPAHLKCNLSKNDIINNIQLRLA